MLVSVMIRTKNRPDMLSEAIASVAAQSHSEVELLVFNDGGVDVSAVLPTTAQGAIQKSHYQESCSGIGRSAAANVLLEAACGQYLIFLDDDDWLLQSHLESLSAQLQKSPDAIAAYSDVTCVNRDSYGVYQEVHRFSADYDPLRLAYVNYLPIHSVLFRREAVDRGCRFDPALEAYEDWAFWVRLAREGRFVRSQGATAVYRLDSGSGFGCPESSAIISRERLLAFVKSVRHHWSDEQLLAMLELYGYQERCHALEKEKLLSEERAVAAELRVEGFERQLEMLQKSTSWRLTAPLRSVFSVLRGCSRAQK